MPNPIDNPYTLLAIQRVLLASQHEVIASGERSVARLNAIIDETKGQWWWRLGLGIRRTIGKTGLRKGTPRFPYDAAPAIVSEHQALLRQSEVIRESLFADVIGAEAVLDAPPHGEALPLLSVVAAVYNKKDSLHAFMAAFALQSYPGSVELVLVDDASTDKSREIIETFEREVAAKIPHLSITLIANSENLGNCASRNRGLEAAKGEIFVVIDADCFVNPDFLMGHWRSHRSGATDVCIGPMDIESKGRALWPMLARLRSDPDFLAQEMHLQYPFKPAVFLNCVTRNFSISRRFIETNNGLLHPLFDEDFSYSKRPGAGFGWEDIEMGYRCFLSGARIDYVPDTMSVHMSHPPAVDESAKAGKAMKNFRRLIEKHEGLGNTAPDWCVYTFRRLCRWLAEYEQEDTADVLAVRERLAEWEAVVPSRVSSSVHQW